MASTRTYALAAATITAIGLGIGGFMALPSGGKFTECGGGVATGSASIGGPFTLTDQTGARVTEADVIDRPTLLYFGYTFCPDVCPVDVAVMSQAHDILSEEGHDVNIAFVTVDPARDTVETIGDFASNLHPELQGLTGSDADISTAAKAYKVYYKKAPGDDPEYYLMDHSAFIYFMDPKEGFLSIFRHGETPDAIAKGAACYLEALGA